MSLSIGTSLAAQTSAIEDNAPSLVLYNGHAGLGANLVGPLSDASVDGRSFDSHKNVSEWCLPEVDDEVLVAFEHGEPRHPFVIAPLWDSKSEPPADNVVSTRTGTVANHPHLDETPIPARQLNDGRDMGDDLQLRLQMAMTSLTQAESTASNLLKKYQDTADAIIKNMKA